MKNIVFLLLVVIASVKHQCQILSVPKPEKCSGSAELLSRQCCIFPPFFRREIAKGCGARFAVMFINNAINVTGLRREASDPCEHWRCILKEYGLVTPKDYLDDVKYFTHLDNWVKLNPTFASIMINAKINCHQRFRMFLPFTPCEFYHLQSCIRNYVNVYCPATINTMECKELKDFYEECREYYE